METSAELIKCPKCGDLVSPFRLKKHLKKVHSPKAEAAREAAHAEKLKQVELGNIFITCEICKNKVRRKNLVSHCKKSHDLYPGQIKQLNDIKGNKFKNSSERESFWREHFGPEPDEEQIAFEKTIILQGGAYGLGKSRKH